MNEKDQEYEEQLAEYKKQVEIRRNFALSNLPALNSGVFMYATETLKALIFICAGGSAAILAFIGHLVTLNQRDMTKALALPLCMFLVSAVMAGVSFGFSYFAQGLVNEAYTYLVLWRDDDIGRYNKKSLWGNVSRYCAIITAVFAFVLCFWSIWKAYNVFMIF
jgi:hypothetical protein